jgi:DNA-binding GntR family transcriptional regulator
MSKTAAARSLSQTAYETLRRDLIDGVLAPGSKLMIADLQSVYGLGAMPLREALNRLSAEDLVQKTEQRGFSVPPLNFEDYLQIQSARIVIESACLRETVSLGGTDWEDRMVVCMHHLSRAGPGARIDETEFLLSDAWAKSHREFHHTLISGCSNRRLLAFASNLYEQSARYRMRTRRIASLRPPARAFLVEEHKAILDAALDGLADTAVELLVEHYRRSVEIVLGRPVRLARDGQRFEVKSETDMTPEQAVELRPRAG